MSAFSIWRGLGYASRVMAYLGIVALFIMMVITVADVIGRYAFNKPILGVFELTEFLVLVLVFSFLAYTQSEKSHVSVDLLANILPPRVRKAVEIFNHTACLGLMFLLAFKGLEKALEMKQVGETSLNLGIPSYPFALFLVLGCVVFCIEYIRNLIRLMTPGLDRVIEGASE